MKAIKRTILILIILAIAVCAVNAQTDFFLNIDGYIPALSEYFPAAAETIKTGSERLSEITDKIPSPSEIIARIKHEELPIDPSDIAVNAYIADSPMLTFYPKENVSVTVNYDETEIFGVTSGRSRSNLMAVFTDENGETLLQESIPTTSHGEFDKTITVPDTDFPTMRLDIYTGSKPYGQFTSWVYNYITLEKTPEGGWQIEEPLVYAHNKEMYEKDKSISEALKSTRSIQSDNDNIISIASQLTDGLESDYDKVLALHDWICSYMYYDTDSISSPETPSYYPIEIIRSRRAVCLGYATLMAALCRSINIPCNVVSGHAIGGIGVGGSGEWTEETAAATDQNHAWNEAYVDGRWVIIDTTWDCPNRIENGEMKTENEVSHLYFDANLKYFSANHKILEYKRRK